MISYLRKAVEKEQVQRKMQEGYPKTNSPWIPAIMDLAVSSKTFLFGPGKPMLKLTFAAEGSNLVQSKSLKMIRKKLLAYYKPLAKVRRGVEKPLPSNTIAVSFSTMNFRVGESCNQFPPFKSFKIPEDAFFTYQKLSENLQATYYNENGHEFLAGLCYFPVSHRMPKILKSDSAAINLAHLKADYYPLGPREAVPNFTIHKAYGRYCNSAGKRVVVGFNNPKGVPRHWTVNFFENKDVYTDCKECAEEARIYKFVEPPKYEKQDKNRIVEEEKVPKVQEADTSKTDTIGKDEDKERDPVDQQATKKEDPLPVLSLLETAGIGLLELNQLTLFPMNAKIPMTHKSSLTQLTEPERPELKELVQFVMLNPNWTIDRAFLPEVSENLADTIKVFHRESGSILRYPPKVANLSSWLDANPDCNVHSSSALIAKFVLGTEYRSRIGGDITDLAEPSINDSTTAESTTILSSASRSNREGTVSLTSDVDQADKNSQTTEDSMFLTDDESDLEQIREEESCSEEEFEMIN